MKTLTKKQQQKNQQPNSTQHQKLNQVQSKRKVSAANEAELVEAAEQLSAYDSYYKQLSEEVETIERHVRELRQTPGLEHLTEAEAHAKADFMLRFSAWVFNQHLQEQQIATIDDKADVGAKSAKVAKVQSPKGRVTKKVTEFLSR